MQSLGSAQTQEKKITLKASTLSMAVMVLVFLVAVVFAANENDVIGWLVVIVSLGWLLLSTFLVFGLRRGAKRVETQLKNATAGMAARAGGPSQTVLVDEATRNRDLKLDHSFKIVQVQVGVITDNIAKPGEEPRQMVARALETIEITAHNAREMMKPGKGASQPVDGEIID